ncbi:MAG: hypothetical protein JNN08_08425 [Bryobacterales bacterium]|nr:hypothetical protein [Bryobacterales bacterium]
MRVSITPLAAEIEQKFADSRGRHKVTPVSDELEGVPLGSLPDNIFGFTSSPLNESTPLFSMRIYQSFEVHKLDAGTIVVLGFVTAQEAETFKAGRESVEVHLYPEPRDEAQTFVEVPLDRVGRAKPMSRSDGNYLPIQLDPVL